MCGRYAASRRPEDLVVEFEAVGAKIAAHDPGKVVVSGALWGLWHAPLILLGYNFGRTDVWGVALMTGAGVP